MPQRRVFFLNREEMNRRFREIRSNQPEMAGEPQFYNQLLGCAGQEANPQLLVITIVAAMNYLGGMPAKINISQHIQAMTDDSELLAEATRIFENVSEIMKRKDGKDSFSFHASLQG